MINIIFTTDYEIHGNGYGSPYHLMVEPTNRNLDLFDKYDAKLTIMADVAEIIRFRDHFNETGRDDFHYNGIMNQLKNSVQRGHDVQLHLHPTYFNAILEKNIWRQNPNSYVLANESYDRLFEMIKVSKNFLVDILREVNPGYECFVFRAGGWQMQPSKNIVKALIDNCFLIDTSVFKNGSRNGFNKFNYAHAFHQVIPWPIEEEEVCNLDLQGKLFEAPIYTEQRPITSFISINRFKRLAEQTYSRIFSPNPMVERENDNTDKSSKPENNISLLKRLSKFLNTIPFKMDYNQCTSNQLIAGLKKAEQISLKENLDIPFILIGHSKSFNKRNEREIIKFLEFVKGNNSKYKFSLFNELQLEIYRGYWEKRQ